MPQETITASLLTVNEVAAYYRVSRAAVYDWIRQEKLTAVRNPGGSIRIRTSDIAEFQCTKETDNGTR